MGFFKRLFGQEKKESLDQGLAKSKQGVMERISRVFTGRRRIDDDLLDDLEEALILRTSGWTPPKPSVGGCASAPPGRRMSTKAS